MFHQLNDADYQETFASTRAGVCIFFKKLCPHCRNMEKVLEKFSSRMPDVRLLSIDSEENPQAMSACGAERAPTIVVLKGGKIAATRAGLMNPKELIAFYEQA